MRARLGTPAGREQAPGHVPGEAAGDPDGRAVAPAGRRAVLAVPALGTLWVLAACTSGDGGPSPTGGTASPSPDQLALTRAAATTVRLLTAVRAATRVPAAVRAAVAADHLAHLTSLGAPVPSGSPSGSATSSPSGSAVPSARSVVSNEHAAAQEALADLAPVTRPVAALLTRVAAARAAHADVVARAVKAHLPGRVDAPSPTPPAGTTSDPSGTASGSASPGPVPTLSPAPTASRAAEDLDALARVVEAEHAAVFAYALVVPRVRKSRRDRADDVWAAHRQTRDAVESLLVAAGATPPAALAAYAVRTPRNAKAAAALAADVEAGVARVGAWAAGRGMGDVRVLAARVAIDADRRRAEWLGTVPPFTS